MHNCIYWIWPPGRGKLLRGWLQTEYKNAHSTHYIYNSFSRLNRPHVYCLMILMLGCMQVARVHSAHNMVIFVSYTLLNKRSLNVRVGIDPRSILIINDYWRPHAAILEKSWIALLVTFVDSPLGGHSNLGLTEFRLTMNGAVVFRK